MTETIACATVLVRDNDEAIEYFTKALGFTLREDTPLGEGKRWVVLAPRGVRFLEAPRSELHGTVAVFADVYGNRWDLIEPNAD